MVRSLDFTAEPGKTYRYRARIVVAAPFARSDDGRSRELTGPWSAAAEAVSVPRE